jgi:hypothetical protein
VISTYIWYILNPHKQASYTIRIAGTFFLCSVFMVIMPFMASLGGPGVNFWACFAAIAMLGPCTGMNNVSLFALSAEIGPYYMSGFMIGAGFGAVLLNILRVWTLF